MKKLKAFTGLLFMSLGGIVLSSCGVLPNEDAAPEFAPLPDNEQDKLVNKIFDTKYLNADLDVNVAYKGPDMEQADNYHVTGNALLDIQSLDNVGANVDLKLDMNNTPEEGLPILDFAFTYTNNTVYLDVNSRSVKLETDNFSELLELLLGSDSGETEDKGEQTNIDNSGIKEIVTNISNMAVENKGDHYEYVSATTKDQPNLVITCDFEYNITSLSIFGVKYQDFTIDVKIDTQVLPSIDKPIVSPETSGHPYINLTNYFGALRKVRAILDDEKFAMQYQLALTHYEPKTPDTKVYLGDTIGVLNMDLANSVADLYGDINISDPRTDDHHAYTTDYHAQYLNESIYLDYRLSNDTSYMLTFSHQGLQDMWDLMGDSDLFGGKNIFDLIFGTSDKEYPIIDILTDATYRHLAKYGSINLSKNYIEVDVDNYLLGGLGHGSIKINLNEDRSIKNVTITSLDINSYIVDGILAFTDYNEIEPVNPDDFHTLDGLDDVIRDGVQYFRSNNYNLGLDFDIIDTELSKTFSVDGDAYVIIHPKDEEDPTKKTGYDGYADVTINDFNNNLHTLKMNANPEGGEENVYALYSYKGAGSPADPVELKLKASRDSISAIFDELTGYEESEEGEGSVDIMEMIAPYIISATKDTLERILKEGDYFSILRDEMIKSISTTNDIYTVVLDKESFGFTQDITISFAMTNEGKITYIHVSTQYDKYGISFKVNLKDNSEPIPSLDDKEGYIPIDSLTNIFMNKELHLDVNANIKKIVNGTPEDYISVSDCTIDTKINDPQSEEEDLWDRLYARVEGNVLTSGDTSPTPFILGYDDNLSIKFGDTAKVTVTRENVRDIIDRAKNVMPVSNVVSDEKIVPDSPEAPLEAEVEGNINMFLTLMEMLSEGNYAKYLNKIKATYLDPGAPNILYITIDNSLFREDDTTEATIAISFNSTGISDISITNFRYQNYALSGNVVLADRGDIDPVDVTGYNKIYNIVDAVLNTATAKDVVLGGEIKMNATLAGIPTGMNRQFSYQGFVHKENDEYDNESVYGYVKFSNVPFLFVGTSEDGLLSYKISDDRDVWKDGDRTFEIYFASTVNYDEYGHTIADENNEVTRTSTVALKAEYKWNGTTKTKEKFLTADDFMADMTYYLLNYGLGIKAKTSSLPSTDTYYGEDDLSTNANDFLNFHNYNLDNNYTPNLSTLLKSYNYSAHGAEYTSSIYNAMTCDTDNECWVITVDGGNLLNNDMLKDIEVFTHTGIDGDISYLKKAILSTKVTVANVATLTVGATLDYDRNTTPASITVNKVKTYITSHEAGYRSYTKSK